MTIMANEDEGVVHNALLVPTDGRVVYAIAFGYPQPDHRANAGRAWRTLIDETALIFQSLPIAAANP